MQTLELRWARRRWGRTNLPTEYLVRSRGLEPPRLAALAPQASASASSATTAMTSIVKAMEEAVKRVVGRTAWKQTDHPSRDAWQSSLPSCFAQCRSLLPSAAPNPPPPTPPLKK